MSCNFCQHIKPQGMSQYCSKLNGKEIVYDQSTACPHYIPKPDAPDWCHKLSNKVQTATPRTDQFIELETALKLDGGVANFARQLERELEHAKEHARIKVAALQEQTSARMKAERERDNAISDHKQADADTLRALHERNEAREQRDALVEALEMVATHTYVDGQCDNGYSPQYVAKQALAALKGGSHE